MFAQRGRPDDEQPVEAVRRCRVGLCTAEQSAEILGNLVAAAATGAETSARLSEIIERLAMELEELGMDAPDKMGRLKEINLLVKASNAASWLAWKLVAAGVIPHPFDLAPARQAPPVQVCHVAFDLAA